MRVMFNFSLTCAWNLTVALGLNLYLSCIGKESLLDLDIENDAEIVKVGDQGVVVSLKPQSLLLRLASPKGMVLQKKSAV